MYSHRRLVNSGYSRNRNIVWEEGRHYLWLIMTCNYYPLHIPQGVIRIYQVPPTAFDSDESSESSSDESEEEDEN